MADDRTDILNLIYDMAARFDAGDLEGAARLMEGGEFVMGDNQAVSPTDMLAIWRRILILYDGSPRTRHIVTNPILTIDEIAGTAVCQSTYTVHQHVSGGPLTTIVCGHYEDRFICETGTWRFSQRRYAGMDLIGDLSSHLTAEAIAEFTKS